MQRDPWAYFVEGDAALHIRFEDPAVWQEEHHASQPGGESQRLPFNPTCVIYADVSGRHDRTKEVTSLLTSLLSEFDGLATDEYTDGFWTLTDILGGTRRSGLLFFDGFHDRGP